MKKNAPKILAVVLLSTIAILMIIAGSGSLVDVFKQSSSNNEMTPIVDAIGDENNQHNNVNTIPNGSEELFTPIEPEINYFPIKAEQSAGHRFIQKMALTSPMLNATHSTTSDTFLVITHETNNGAFMVASRTQSIIKIDGEGNILACYSIKNNNQTDYACSKVTSQGLVLVVKDDTITYVYTITLDFKQVELIELPIFSSVNIFALSDSFLVFGTSSENTIYKIQNNTIVSSNVLQLGIIKEIYDFSNYYALFSCSMDGYSFIKISPDLKLLSSVSIPNKTVLAVAPIIEEGVQKFIVAEHTPKGVEIAKYDTTFSIAQSERVGVGLAERAKVFINGESVFLLLQASTNRLYLVDKHLSFTSSNNTTFQGMTELFDCALFYGGYLILYAKGERLMLTDIRNDGTIESINLDVSAKSAYINLDQAGNYSVTYQYGNEIIMIGIK